MQKPTEKMSRKFTTSCFIRKNTAELRKKLEKLGYEPTTTIFDKGKLCIATCVYDQCTKYANIPEEMFDSTNPYVTWNCAGRIDCGTNENLFLALAALSEQTDYMQWFCDNRKYKSFFLCKYAKVQEHIHNEMDGWYCDGFHKATVEELIEYFKVNIILVMKYKVGDEVRIKSLDWYNSNKRGYDIRVSDESLDFVAYMSKYCGKKATITKVCGNYYHINIDNGDWKWCDYMFEENIEKRIIKISLNKAREWYKAGGDLKEVALQAFTKEELELSFENIKTFEDVCKALGIADLHLQGIKNTNWDKQDAKDTCDRCYALGKLAIIRKALNQGYEMKFTEGNIYYPRVFFINKNCNMYRHRLNNGELIKVSDFNIKGKRYTLIGGCIASGVYNGLSDFNLYENFSRCLCDIGVLGCATEEIAKHMSRYFAKEIFEAMYEGLVDFEWVNELS